MQYDALHRLTGKTYTDGTAAKYYSYDVAPSWMSDLTNVVGRLVEARNQFSGTTGSGTSTVNSYDAMGRIIRQWQQTPPIAPGGNFLYYSYDLAGDMTSYTNGAGVTITQPFSGAGSLIGVTSTLSDANHPGTLLSNVHYNALGEMSLATLGNGAVETLGYAPRGWQQSLTVTSEATGTPGNGTVTINGSEKSWTLPNTPGWGSVSISGLEYQWEYCGDPYWDGYEWDQDCYWVNDQGDVWVNVNGWPLSTYYPYDWNTGQSTYSSYAIASTLASYINSTSGYPVTAWAQDDVQYAGVVMQNDGNFVEYGPAGNAAWSTGTGGYWGSAIVMQDDGNLVIYYGGYAVWATNESSPGVVSPSMSPGCSSVGSVLSPNQALQAGQCLVSDSGTYELVMQWDGNLVLYDLSGTYANYPVALWADYANAPPSDNGNSTLWLTSTQSGPQTNYSLSAGSDGDPNQGWLDYNVTPSGSTLTGGSGGTVPDTGGVTVTINGSPASVTYGNGSTGSTIASQLASSISGLGFVVGVPAATL